MSKPLDPLLIAKIQQVAIDKAANNEMFTAFDVSRAVQNMGHKERHNNMKEHVHDVFATGQLPGYSRTLVVVEQGKPEAWVYHPQGVDPNTYTPTYQPLPNNIAPHITPGAFYQGNPSTGNPSLSSVTFQTSPRVKGKHKPDQRGAVTVPAALITKIGAKAGDKLAVDPKGTTLVISKNLPGRYTVNTSNNIRIKRKVWSQICDGSGEFEFEEKNGEIVVTHK
jgi:hypothetical protein